MTPTPEQQQPSTSSGPFRRAIVGCGSQKRDLSGDDDPIPIFELYTSTYFNLKWQYREHYCDDGYVLSAKHGLVHESFMVSEPYDCSVNDLEGRQLTQWVSNVSDEFQRIADSHPDDTLVMLLGQSYLNPLEQTLSHLPNNIEYPFAETSGIGDQMGWLKQQIEASERK